MNVYPFARVVRAPTPAQGRAIQKFGAWLRQRHPEVHAEILSRYPGAFDPSRVAFDSARLAGLGADLVEEPQTSWGQTIADLAKTVITAYQSNELFRTNLRLAEQGKPPLDPSVYSPSVTVRAGMSPEVQQALLWGGLGLAALWILTLWAKHARTRP